MEKDSLLSNKQPRENIPRGGELFAHWIVLFFCAGILLSGLVLSPPSAGSPHMSIGQIPIPDTCSFKNLTGLPCPGCGLTRSIVVAMHCDFGASLMYHRLGLLTLVYILLQFFYRVGTITFPTKTTRIFGSSTILNRGIIALAILYALNWGYTLLLLEL
jgi:hypothetical protein